MKNTTLRLLCAVMLLAIGPVDCAKAQMPFPSAPSVPFPTAETAMRRYAIPDPRAGLAANLYSYNNADPVNFIDPYGTAGFKPCVTMCARTDLIQSTAPIGAGMVSVGMPVIPYPRPGLGGSTGYTSPASQLLSSLLPQKTDAPYCTPTLNNPGASSRVLGRIIGRYIPIIGGGILVFDGGFMTGCTGMCMALLDDWQVPQ